MKTCAKQAISFWDYPGHRLGVPDVPAIPSLAGLTRARPLQHVRPVLCPYYQETPSARG
jgi:hypothetical protein